MNGGGSSSGGGVQVPGMYGMGGGGRAGAEPQSMPMLGMQEMAMMQQQHQQQEQLRMQQQGVGVASRHDGACAAGDAAPMSQAGAGEEAGSQGGRQEEDPTVMQDLEYADDDFAEEVKDFVQSLITDSNSRTWEQVCLCARDRLH